MNQFAKYTFSFFLFLIFFSCKKYEDGGLHLYAKRNLLSHDGKWSLEKYEVNGIDSTDYVISNNDPSIKKEFVRIFKSSNQYYFQIQGQNLYTSLLASGKKDLDIGYLNPNFLDGEDLIDGISIRRIFTPDSKNATWQIQKLTKHEFILIRTTNNIYKISLKEKK
jgi:hypothetical protein